MATKSNEPVTVSVTWEDQKKICTFGRLYKRRKDLAEDEAELKKRLVCANGPRSPKYEKKTILVKHLDH